jgi:hypothetical protein
MKKSLISAIFLVLAISLSSQAPMQHPAKIFVSPEGKMYINKGLPLYLRISTSPDPQASSFLLRSEHTSKYSNPMYLDTEGLNTVRSPSAVDTATKEIIYPVQDIIFEVYADSRPPSTQIKFTKGNPFQKDGKYYLDGKVEIEMSSRDEMSGVEQILLSINNEAWTKYTEPFQLKKENEYVIRFYAVDNVGNVEKLQSRTVVIDKSAPNIAVKVEGDFNDSVTSGRSRIKIEAIDPASGVSMTYFRFDSGVFKPYTLPLSTAYMVQGDHQISYYSIDHLGNKNEEQSFHFYVDKTPPIIVQEFIGKSFIANGHEYASGKTLVKLTTMDNKAGVKAIYYSINGGEFQQYDKPFYPSDVKGELVLKAYAIDFVNNKSPIDQGDKKVAGISYVDLNGPVLKFDFDGPVFHMEDTVFICEKTKLRLKGWDSEAGLNRIEFKIDNGEYQSYSGPFEIAMEGKHVVHFIGYDNVDNSNQESFLAVVDNTGPQIFSQFSISARGTEQVDGRILDRYPAFAVLFVSSTDNRVGFDRMFYSLNGKKETPYAGMIGSFQTRGKCQVKIKALDKLGNASLKDLEFIISDIQNQ